MKSERQTANNEEQTKHVILPPQISTTKPEQMNQNQPKFPEQESREIIHK